MSASQPAACLLAPLDNTMPRVHVPKLLFFPRAPRTDVSGVEHSFRSGLQMTLNAIPLLSGTVQNVKNGAQQGALCVAAPWHAASDLFHVKDLTHVDELNYARLKDAHFPMQPLQAVDLLPVAKMRAQEKAVLLVQLNVVRGGIVVALCMHHSFTDGNGTIAIARVWAACCRGEDGSGYISQGMLDRDAMAFGDEDASLDEFPQFSFSSADVDFRRLPEGAEIEGSIFFFSDARLADLKSQASSEARSEDEDDWISTNDAFSSLLMCCICSTQRDDASEKIVLGETAGCKQSHASDADKTLGLNILMSIRRVVEPPLSPEYLGNPLNLVHVAVPRKEMGCTMGKVAEVARLTRRQIKKVDDLYVRRMISALKSVPDIGRVQALAGVKTGQSIRISSWSMQDFYELDWGEAIR